MPAKLDREGHRDRLRREHVVAAKKRIAVTATKVDAALKVIHKKYGNDSITTFLTHDQEPMQCFSTGHPTIDDVLTGDVDDKMNTVKGSGKGLPTGRIIEIYGPESAGKSTLMLEFIKGVQESGGRAAYIDVEHAFDPRYAQKGIGIDMATLLFSQPTSAEQALGIAVDLAKSKAVDLIVIDSVAALVPEREDEKDVGAHSPGLHAKLMSQALRKITGYASRNKVTVIFVNQIRNKIGVFFGSPETTTGGLSLKFYASIRLDIRRVKTLKKGTKAYGIRSRVRAVKNKVSVPFREWHMDIERGQGITHVYGDLEFAGGGGGDDD